MLRPLSTREKTAEEVQEHPAVQLKKVKKSRSVDVVLHPRRDTQRAGGSGLHWRYRGSLSAWWVVASRRRWCAAASTVRNLRKYVSTLADVLMRVTPSWSRPRSVDTCRVGVRTPRRCPWRKHRNMSSPIRQSSGQKRSGCPGPAANPTARSRRIWADE